jgi:hypothetical protein
VTVRPANPLVNSVRSADGPWLLDPDAAPDAGDDDADGQITLPLGDPGA